MQQYVQKSSSTILPSRSLMYIGLARKYKRALLIRKMRRTDHSDKIHPIKITESGMKIVAFDKELDNKGEEEL